MIRTHLDPPVTGSVCPAVGKFGWLERAVHFAVVLCLIAGIVIVDCLLWLGLVFAVASLFALFEAVRGWCLARACSIRTRF
jgi:cytochrome b subunit of formate dehydrogenase